MVNLKKYKKGFTVSGKHPIETEDWLFSKVESNPNKLVFLGFDANLSPMPNLSERPDNEYNRVWFKKLKRVALEFTKDFKGEVWLDDVKIKEGKEC